MQSSNPVFRDSMLRDLTFDQSTTMSVNGTVVKTLISLCLVFLTAGMVWIQFRNGADIMPWVMGGGLVGFGLAIATCFKPDWAAWTTPAYSLAEGCFLGGISAIAAARFPTVPIVFQACCLTFGTLFAMLILYQTGVIKVTERLRSCVMAATGAVALLYLASIVLRLFGFPITFIHSSGGIGIAFSLFVVGLAAFNLVLDFDLIDRLVARRAPKQMEWYAAFALMVTLVWLYIEILRLLSKLNSRR